MKKFTVILLVIMGVVIFLGSMSNLWAENLGKEGKSVFFLFRLTLDNQGNITGVEALNPQTGGLRAIEGKTGPITGIVGTATLLMLDNDDPCVVYGGKSYCW